MSGDTYDTAVEAFEALVSQPLRARHTTPAGLIRATGLAQSTGYRHIAAMEAEGFLRRDASGAYLPGLSAVRTGLAAFGAGQIAPVSDAIVTQLRQATQHTAFLGMCEDLRLAIGPYANGRETRHLRIQPLYQFEGLADLSDGGAQEIGLRYLEAGMARRASALVVSLSGFKHPRLVLGLMLGGHRSANDALSPALEEARRQVEGLLAPLT